MDAPAFSLEVALGPSVSVRTGAPPSGDAIFLPTDLYGTPGELNTTILSRLELPLALPSEAELANGFRIVLSPRGLICYIVTVGLDPPAQALRKHLAEALRSSELGAAREIWVPLMGTGAGQLPQDRSFEITLEALKASGWLDRPDRHATIATPPELPPEDVRALHAAIRKAQIAGERPSGDDVHAFAKSAAVDGVLALAAAFVSALPKLEGDGRPISSALLFFALAESQSAAAPPTLVDDGAADLFASAVRELAGTAYAAIWRSYFSAAAPLPMAEPGAPLPPLTDNVEGILRTAAATAQSRGAAVIGTDHLIDALLRHGEAQTLLGRIGLGADRLLREYADARLGQVTMKFRNDVASSVDRLGYDGYASAIVEFLTHAETPPPLSISIQAPWGGGKSSLMNLVREKLDPQAIREAHKPRVGVASGERLALGTVLKLLDRSEPFSVTPDTGGTRLWTIWFNAWKYETSEQIWAGLVDAIVSQVAERLPLVEREKFLLKLQLARIDDGIVRKRIYDRVLNIWWSKVRAWTLAGAGMLASLLGLTAASALVPDPILKAIGLWAGAGGSLAVPVILSVYLVGTYFKSRGTVRAEPAAFSLADFIRVPDYDKAVGEIHQIHADLRRVLGVVPAAPGSAEQAPIVIFIDDLDRCSPGKVAGVVEGVSMLLASDTYRCMFVIGMDPQMVAAALEKAHEDVRRQLPRYERTVPLGWRFMDKFVQLPFTIPPAPGARFVEYVDWLSDAPALPGPEMTKGGSPPAPAPPVPPDPSVVPGPDAGPPRPVLSVPDPVVPDPAPTPVASFPESRDVGAIVRAITRDAVGNPREMKRMINLARFYLALRAARRRRDAGWRAPAPEQYARWIAVTLRWPDMMRWLQWGADEALWSGSAPGDDLVVRRLLKLEAIAAGADGLAAWKTGLKDDLMVPVEKDADWGCDPKLFEFFRAEDALPGPHRLSAAARRGFW